jgi:superfamily II DNA or RNA helicase
MNTIINNDKIIISDINLATKREIVERLSFTDKSKQYQLKRLNKTIWGKTSQQAAKLKNEINQTLVTEINATTLEIPTGLLSIIQDLLSIENQDNRHETGPKISLPWANKPHNLRDYQEEAKDLMVNNYRGLINLATGLGKTATAVHTIRTIGRKTLVICPNKSIAQQFYSILVYSFGDSRVGFYGDGKKKIKDITVGIAQSVVNAIPEFKKQDLGLIIVDETHHIAANTFYTIAMELSSVGRIFGLTATDFRNDGKDLMITAGCGPTLIRRDAKWGIENGWLAQPFFMVRTVNTDGRDYSDDKLKNYKAHVLNCQIMKDQILSDAQNFLNAGRRVLIIVDEVAHGTELSNQLGIPFATGEDKNSQSYINDFNNLKTYGLIATEGKAGEGVDTKPVEVLIMANFVASKGAVLQVIGRGLRKTDTKNKCIIIDYIPNGSTMLRRHAYQRIEIFKTLTDNVKVI